MFRQTAKRFVLIPSLIVLAYSEGLLGDEGERQATDSVIAENSEPAFAVRANLNHISRQYRAGDELRIAAVSERDGFLYAFYKQADGKVFQIFPNSGQPDNRITARQQVQLPVDEDQFRWRVASPYGKETIKIVVTAEPIKELSSDDMRAALFNPVDAKQAASTNQTLANLAADQWAEFELSLTTLPRSAPVADSGPRRHGVFFGVSHYEFNDLYRAATEQKRSLDLATCAADSVVMARVMNEVGGLDEVRAYTNEHATRERMQQEITRRLPRETRPGDTVFIYFSGHGSQIPDNNRDEADQHDELLLPFDYVPSAVLNQLLIEQKNGSLDSSQIQQLNRLQRLAGLTVSPSTANSIEDVRQRLSRGTGVTDDLMGRWLQHLDGRNVVVILDICHAGGFAQQEKGLKASGRDRRFDFLDLEMTRLKDLGQRGTVLMASSSASNTSQTRQDRFPADFGPLSVMTSYLVDAVLSKDATVTLRHALTHCENGMADYFSQRPNRDSHQPWLLGDSQRHNLYLKQ